MPTGRGRSPFELGDDRVVAAAPREVDRSTPSLSGMPMSAPPSRSARTTLDVAGGAVAEHDRLVQRPSSFRLLTWFGSTPASSRISTVDSSPRSEAGIRAVPPKRFVLVRSAPLSSVRRRISSCPAGAGVQVGGILDVVLRVHVGAGLDEHSCRVDLIPLGRRDQGGHAAVAPAPRSPLPHRGPRARHPRLRWRGDEQVLSGVGHETSGVGAGGAGFAVQAVAVSRTATSALRKRVGRARMRLVYQTRLNAAGSISREWR